LPSSTVRQFWTNMSRTSPGAELSEAKKPRML
jgi:hypothetical protein